MSTNTNIKLNLAIKMVLGYHNRPEGVLRQKMYKASVILSRIRLDEYIEKT